MKNTKNRFENAPKLPSEYEEIELIAPPVTEEDLKELEMLVAPPISKQDFEEMEITSIHYKFKQAISNYDIKIVRELIEQVDINYSYSNNNTPIMFLSGLPEAISTIFLGPKDGQIEILNLLLEHGADINHKNNMGMTPLMHYALKGEDRLVKILIDNGADINVKSEMTAFDLASNEEIRKLIKSTTNHTPQKLVKLLSNFTIDKPIKYTTHTWDFGDIRNSEHKNFDSYMLDVNKQFESMQSELEELSPNLSKKVYTFLLETNLDEDYSWCSKGNINIGWSSLDGLKEHCDSGKNPFDFRLKKAIALSDGTRARKFGDVIDLFKQEIEVRRDFKTLEKIFNAIGKDLPDDFVLFTSKLEKQFYTDVAQFTIALGKIFEPISKSTEFKKIEVEMSMPQSEYFELHITHIDSPSTLNSKELLKEVESGDFADIKANLTNLCDWSVEGSYKDEYFRLNYLKSNNVKDVEILEYKPKGFTHILRFYK